MKNGEALVRKPAGRKKSVAIVGGGAAGLMAACLLARAGVACTLLEKQARVGRKLLSTGNGRCNLSNLHASSEFYHGSKRHIDAALKAFPPQSAVDFFEEIGVECVSDEEGRVYPLSNQAASVLDALRLYADEHGVQTLTEFPVKALTKGKRGFVLQAADGRSVQAEYVIVACGGLAAPKLGGCGDGYALLESFGHRLSLRCPAIAALTCDGVRGLKGLRARCELALYNNEEKCLRRERGEILFGENGVSGIAAMQMARDVNLSKAPCTLKINFLPETEENCIDLRVKRLPERSMEDFLTGILPKRLGQAVIKAAGVAPLSIKAKELSPAQRKRIFACLTGWELKITGTLSFDSAQVTCGGALLKQFDLSTLESQLCEGLFAAGEVLDVDGDCGGFNLHWAWASAYMAANAIIRRTL